MRARSAVVGLPGLHEARECAGSRPRSRPGRPSASRRGPVAPSSRISPPEPVAAPGNGEIAVGWLCVSTLIRMSIGSSLPAVMHGRRAAAKQRAAARALDHGGIVAVGGQHAARARRSCVLRIMRTATVVCATPSMTPVGVEDLVPAMLGVRLREHHQLDVRRVAAEPREDVGEVVDLVVREREAQRLVPREQAPRGSRPSAMCSRASARGVRLEQAPAASALSSSASVIRSWSGAASAASDSPGACARRPRLPQDLPRSMRRTQSRPQTWAMSVALLDQGEIVPRRGTVQQAMPRRLRLRACDRRSSRRSSTSRSAGVEVASRIDEMDVLDVDAAGPRARCAEAPRAVSRAGSSKVRRRPGTAASAPSTLRARVAAGGIQREPGTA